MKNLRLMFSAAVVGSAVLGIGTASAADLPMKAPPLAAALPCVWCGFYVGVNAGYAGSESTSVNSIATVTSAAGLGGNLIFPAAAAAALTTPISVGNGNGFIGGGQVGYNFQASNFVAGIEADIQGLSGRGTGTVVTSAPIPVFQSFANATLTATNSVNWLGTVRGRIGLAVAPNFLLYGTGGLAYGGVRSSTGISEAIAGPGAVGSGLNGTFPALGSFSQTRAGWTAGAGGEWMFNGNWSAKLEYLHYDLGSATYGTTVSNFTVAPSPPGILLYTLGQTSTTSFRGDIVRVGLNYKFSTAPLVAKY